MLETTTSVPPRLTRRQGVVFLREKHGIPITFSHFVKLCSSGEGPEPDERWGRYDLYAPTTLLEWALKRLRPGKTKATA